MWGMGGGWGGGGVVEVQLHQFPWFRRPWVDINCFYILSYVACRMLYLIYPWTDEKHHSIYKQFIKSY